MSEKIKIKGRITPYTPQHWSRWINLKEFPDDVPAKPVPKKPKEDSPLVAEAKKMGATKALKEYGLNKSQVEQTIGTKVSEIIDFNKSWEFLAKNVGESHEK